MKAPRSLSPAPVRPVALAVALVLVGIVAPELIGGAAEVRFDHDIRPILAEHCLECHGLDAGSRQGDLRLDTAEGAKPQAVLPGRPDESELVRRILATDPDLRMPPPAKGPGLTATEIDTLRRWIAAGAPYEGHWAFAPIRRPPVPATSRPASTDIDRFLASAREARGLAEPPRIGRRELIRRATFDLTGLPPVWEEVEAFETDISPESEAFARVVDRLLASPRYGERWGRHWLDIARYADTHGGSAIGFTKFPFSYTYRDYCVRSFNGDIPWDRFITEQVAADQMGLAANDPALAGLGFLTIGMQFRNRHDLLDDQIDVVSRGLMGLTIACARCHDHKYDPVTASDYYALAATLAPSQPPELPPVIGSPEETPALADYRRELQRRQTIRDDMARDQIAVMQGRLRMQVGLYLRELAKGTPEQDLTSAFLSFRTDDVRPHVLNRWRTYLATMPADDPVFGPWVRLRDLPAADVQPRCAEIVAALTAENGDPAAAAAKNGLGEETPKWNPLVLASLAERNPATLADVADAYGAVFATAQREWLGGLAASAEEGVGEGIVTDEDPRHIVVNSPIRRQLRHHLFAPGTPTAVDDTLAKTLLNRTVQDTLSGKAGAIHELHLGAPGSPPRAMTLEERADAPATRLLVRGNPLNRGPVVEARFPVVLSAADAAPFPAGQRRLGLAAALVSPDNPLVRRVIVNWAWQHHFGAGLVRTPDDFGTRGRPPTHPELLDFLAETFRDDGWSLKSLHRRIMLSDAYRTAAVETAEARQADPDDELLWRMPRRRLDMESMRDAMLAVSGELDPTPGGPPVDLEATPIVPRRTVYGFVNRDILSPLSGTFDGANPAACTARRPDTTIPQQALFALNSNFIQDRAVAFAAAGLRAAPADETGRVSWMVRRAFSRSPSEAETTAAIEFVHKQAASLEPGLAAEIPWQRLAHVLLAANEFHFVD
ncbi:MAG: PSD1 and planctomycete cytochrome C domain-containing protein [Planctomycetota bacterium]|nr:PSD1 and planctomycete cytochrome C domain-containing protein [Planctomycetota bacterium]